MEGTEEVKDGAGRESIAGDAISTVLLVFGLFLLLFFTRSSICLMLYSCFLPIISGPIFIFFVSPVRKKKSNL
jgi:hypothetical protein